MWTQRRAGFSLLEIMMAVAIIGFCFLPILTHSQATVTETEESQESLLARHYLIDMVERYKGSSLAELRQLPPPSAADPQLGQDPPILKNDVILSDNERVAAELKARFAGGSYKDGGTKGFGQFVDLANLMKLTRVASFVENAKGPGMHELSCAVLWQPRKGGSVKKVKLSKVLMNVP